MKKILSKNIIKCPIVLIGMMGVGKTSVGRLLAEKLLLPFYDSDNEIENKLGLDIKEIFKKNGEGYFRKREVELFETLIEKKPSIIATGGGSFINKKIHKNIKEKCISIWLKASAQTLIKRLKNSESRPLLDVNDPKGVISSLLSEREGIYSKADIIIDVDELNESLVVQNILQYLESYLIINENEKI